MARRLAGCMWGSLWGEAKAFMTHSLDLSLTVPLREGGRKMPLFPCGLQDPWILGYAHFVFLFLFFTIYYCLCLQHQVFLGGLPSKY